MAPIRIGILSDTHLSRPSEQFNAHVEACFADVSIILHAGDLTSSAILDVFQGKELYAVHGNMCDSSSRAQFPAIRQITINDFTIILTHGYGYGYHDIEDHLFNKFAEADCIIYGHTHNAVCHQVGHILFINPGSFGQAGTYAILEVDHQLRGHIKQVPELP